MLEQRKTFFEQPVNMKNRKDMVDFLKAHRRYYAMNSWNRLTTWANHVKLYALNMPKDADSMAYRFLLDDVDRTEWDEIMRGIIRKFEAEYNGNYTIRQNGRSGGYLILDTKNGRRITNEPDEYDIAEKDFPLADLKENAQLVVDFDRACDEIRTALIEFCSHCEIIERAECIEFTTKYVRKKEDG